MKKKILSAALVLALVLCFLPMTALAETTVLTEQTLKEAITNADGKTTIKLGEDIVLSAGLEIPSGKVIILDLNGKKLDRGLKVATADGYVILNNGTLTIQDTSESGNGTITGGYNQGGAGGVKNNSNFTMTGGMISGNKGTYGGGIRVESGSNATLYGGKISNNEATDSAGGINLDGTLTIYGGEISNNKATRCGGGISQWKGSILQCNDGKISGNTACDGGGIYSEEANTIINGGEISNNSASNAGGALKLINTAVTMYDGKIIENSGKYAGGIDCTRKSSLTMNGGIISKNIASESTYSAGAICVNDTSTATLNGGFIVENKGRNGGILVGDPAPTLILGGNIVIANNVNLNDSPSDLYCDVLADMIVLGTTPKNGMCIGLESRDGYFVVNNANSGQEKYFFANKDTEYVEYIAEGKKIVVSAIPANNFKIKTSVGKNGSINVPKFGEKEKTITVNVSPDKGYQLKNLVVTDSDGGSVEVKGNSFIMPEKMVTVTAEFEKKIDPISDIFELIRFKKTTDDIKTFSIFTLILEFIRNIISAIFG